MAPSDAYAALLADLAAEQAALADVVDRLDDGELELATPSQGWAVRDQLSHLAGFDDAAVTALVDPDRFAADLQHLIESGADPVAAYTERGREMAADAVLAWWRSSRAELLARAAEVDAKTRVPWYGPPMSAMSFVTARLMETWAHGQDVRDTVGVAPSVSARLRHVAHIGVGARTFSYVVRGLEPPTDPVDVVLAAPDGSSWSWGTGDAPDRVSGDAVDFCLVVTQRRNVADTGLVVEGALAVEWIGIAQAFAGAASPPRPPA